jgi:hypothetical protein
VQVRTRRYGESIEFKNPTTGNRLEQTDLAAHAAQSLLRLRARTLKDLTATFEHFLAESWRIHLGRHPGEIEGKSVTVEDILSSSSLAEAKDRVIRRAVDATIRDKAYQKPEKWFNFCQRLYGDKGATTQDIEALVEIKATRDLLEHAGGKVNQEYLDKAGGRSRAEVGTRIPVDENYLEEAYDLVVRLVNNISALAIQFI